MALRNEWIVRAEAGRGGVLWHACKGLGLLLLTAGWGCFILVLEPGMKNTEKIKRLNKRMSRRMSRCMSRCMNKRILGSRVEILL